MGHHSASQSFSILISEMGVVTSQVVVKIKWNNVYKAAQCLALSKCSNGKLLLSILSIIQIAIIHCYYPPALGRYTYDATYESLEYQLLIN